MLVWENTQHTFREAREMTSEERQAQIPYWWHATILIWVVLPIGPAQGKFASTNQSTIQIWVVTRHQYKISALVPQTPFAGKLEVACTSRKAGCSLRLYLRQEVVSTLNFAVLHNQTVLSKTVLQARAKTGNILTPLRDYLWKRLRENSNKEQYKLRLT